MRQQDEQKLAQYWQLLTDCNELARKIKKAGRQTQEQYGRYLELRKQVDQLAEDLEAAGIDYTKKQYFEKK